MPVIFAPGAGEARNQTCCGGIAAARGHHDWNRSGGFLCGVSRRGTAERHQDIGLVSDQFRSEMSQTIRPAVRPTLFKDDVLSL